MSKALGFTHDNKDNVSFDWYTPPWVFERIGLRFDLDPCQPKEPIPWIPADKHFWLEVDGLSQPWNGNVWLNPPYGKNTPDWLAKMHTHRRGVALVFARTDCRWFHDYCITADAILFLRGRIAFVDGLGITGKGGAGAGSMLIAWGVENVKALQSMQDIGFLVKPSSVTNDDAQDDLFGVAA